MGSCQSFVAGIIGRGCCFGSGVWHAGVIFGRGTGGVRDPRPTERRRSGSSTISPGRNRFRSRHENCANEPEAKTARTNPRRDPNGYRWNAATSWVSTRIARTNPRRTNVRRGIQIRIPKLDRCPGGKSRTKPTRVRWLHLHNRLWSLKLDQELTTNEYLTTWTVFTNEASLGGVSGQWSVVSGSALGSSVGAGVPAAESGALGCLWAGDGRGQRPAPNEETSTNESDHNHKCTILLNAGLRRKSYDRSQFGVVDDIAWSKPIHFGAKTARPKPIRDRRRYCRAEARWDMSKAQRTNHLCAVRLAVAWLFSRLSWGFFGR